MKHINIQTGIELWEGLPGSGKTYGVVDFLIEIVLRARRPVFTNLPLRFPVLRHWLKKKGGVQLAQYLIPLTPEHFRRFVKRFGKMARHLEQRRGEGWRDAQIEAEFLKLNGPHIWRGRTANWIPPGAVVIIDELHRWYDQRTQDDNDPELLTYCTMHRHALHWLILISQNRMQVSIEWRRNCVRFVRCVDKRKLPFLFGLKMPIPAFYYEEWPAEFAKSDSISPTAKPADSWVKIPWFNGGLIWRFYSSHSHMGSFRSLTKKLEEARRQLEGEAYTGGGVGNMGVKRDLRWLIPVAAVAAVVLLILTW